MRLRKILSVAISAIIIVTSLVVFNDSSLNQRVFKASAELDENKTYSSWQEGYWDKLIDITINGSYCSKETSGESMCSTYAIHDMNNDGIPELFINYAPVTAAYSELYTFYDSKVVKLFTLPRAGFATYSKENGLICSSGGGGAGGYAYETYSKIIDGKDVVVDSFSVSWGTTPYTYTRNGQNISEEEYKAGIQQYESMNWTTVGRENYFEDLYCIMDEVYYKNYFDYYVAWFLERESKKTSVTLKNTINGLPVKSISNIFFKDNSTVKTLNLPANINDFYYYAFEGAKALTTINVDAANKTFKSENGVLYDKDMTMIYRFPPAKDASTYAFPESITYIGRFSFAWCKGVKKIVIPERIRMIDDYAFYYCQNLASLTILNPECDIYDYWDDKTGVTICNSYESTTDTYNYLGVISGYYGSTAQDYAENFDRTFISLGVDPRITTTSTTTTTTTTTSTTTTTTTKRTTTSTTTTTITTTKRTSATTTTTKKVTSTTPLSTTTPRLILGDVNNDGMVNAVDASSVLAYYAMISTNQDGGYNDNQKAAADVNHDGQVNAVDASNILAYYAYLSTTKENIISLAEYINKR